jgi:hypothetical protein
MLLTGIALLTVLGMWVTAIASFVSEFGGTKTTYGSGHLWRSWHSKLGILLILLTVFFADIALLV